MAAKFVVKKGTTGKFRFSLLSTNGQVVASSEAYNTKASAMGGIRSIQKLAADAAVEDQTTREWAAGESARKEAATAKKAAARTSAAKKRAGATAKASSRKTSAAKTPARKAAARTTTR